jgi:pepF/M3 family oligoendopeptidase
MSEQKLPHWDVSSVYPSLDSKEFEQGFEETKQAIADLEALFYELNVSKRESIPFGRDLVRDVERVIGEYNRVQELAETMRAYLMAFVTTNSRDDLAMRRWSEIQPRFARLGLLGTRLVAWLGSMDVECLIEASPLAAEHAYPLRRAKVYAAHLMSPAEEDLAAELGITGSGAWGKFYGTFTSQIMVDLEVRGERKKLPMSAVRNLALEPDRQLRQTAYQAELAAWEAAAVPLAAAFNSIKGEVLTLSKRRGWESPLDAALFQNAIDRQILDAMFSAARESFPYFRRYLKAKARAMDLKVLAWYDLFAPVAEERRAWSFDEARAFIVETFAAYSPRLSQFAERAFREHWIDAEPRSGKRGGAFCMRLRGEESRILANYKESFEAVSTLAHELGHGYHNLNLAQRSPLQRRTPMTLAETASIFCQSLVIEAASQEASQQERLLLLEASLQDACQVVVDISSRFQFESQAFQRREKYELSVDELKELMLQAQGDTYAEALDPEQLHPFMWAVKPHYYNAHLSFYNFPYMFGLLFGKGLFALYKDDPQGFRRRYDELLASTGLFEAAQLAAQFGFDVRQADFWRKSLEAIRQDVEAFEAMVEAQEARPQSA